MAVSVPSSGIILVSSSSEQLHSSISPASPFSLAMLTLISTRLVLPLMFPGSSVQALNFPLKIIVHVYFHFSSRSCCFTECSLMKNHIALVQIVFPNFLLNELFEQVVDVVVHTDTCKK
uniref:Uncharacterized protein n=1 Tax=Cacopsylla melanoneura TaxID=428564 RepID=A0A8D9E9I1_9HEMI